MPPSPSETISLRGRFLGSIAALALLALHPASALALPPAVDWHPVSLTAARGDVHISPGFDASGPDKPGAASIRISNLNPFPIAVHDLIVPRRTSDFDALYIAPLPVELAPFAVALLRLEATEWVKVDSAAHARRPLPPIRMLLLPTEAHQTSTQETLDGLRRALDADPTDPLPDAIDEGDQGWRRFLIDSPYREVERLALLAHLTRQEASLASQTSHRPAEAALASETHRALLDALAPLACAFERRHALRLLDEGQPLDRHLDLYNRGEQAGFRACVHADRALSEALVNEALEVDAASVAQDISARFDQGLATPEPFKRALVQWQTRRILTRLPRQLLKPSAEGQPLTRLDPEAEEALDFFDLAEAIKGFEALERLAPDHPLKGRLGDVAATLAALARARAEDSDFRRANLVMTQLDALIELIQRLDPGQPLRGAQRARDEARREIAWNEGQFIFHYQRGKPGALEEARLLFIEARAHAPIRSRLYEVGILLVEHQFKALAALLLLCGMLWWAARSPTAARLWLRLARREALARARRRPHEAGAVAWRLLTRTLALSGAGRADEALRALVAADLIGVARRIDDGHLMQEAAGHLQRVEPGLRPLAWRTPQAALEQIAAMLDGDDIEAPAAGSDGDLSPSGRAFEAEAARAIEAQATLLAQIFGEVPEVAAARALALDARCRATARESASALRADEARSRLARRGDEALSATFEAASAASLSLIEGGGLPAWLDALMRERLGLLTAALGPAASADKEGAWRRAWALLRVEAQGRASSARRRSLAMAAGAGAPLVDAVEVLEREGEALDGEPGGRAALKAALSAAASRASLPLPTASDAQPVDRAVALLALARLDDLMARWMEPEEALGGRLRIAILRRVGGRAGGLEALDEGYAVDLMDLFAQARARRHDPGISALASVLDLLTEGDRGFDAQVEAAEGQQRALYLLLEALDHHGAGRSVEAAAALAGAEPEGAGVPRAARLLGTRALVAASIGQRRAALEALGRADALAAGDATTGAVVDKVAGRLMALIVEAGQRGALLERAIRGRLIDEELPTPVWPWHTLGEALAPSGDEAVTLAAIKRSERLEGGLEAERGRRRALLALARGAVRRGDFEGARSLVARAGGLREGAEEGLRAQ